MDLLYIERIGISSLKSSRQTNWKKKAKRKLSFYEQYDMEDDQVILVLV